MDLFETYALTKLRVCRRVDSFIQNVTFGPNKAANIDYDSNELVAGRSFTPTFQSYAPNNGPYMLEFASYGE